MITQKHSSDSETRTLVSNAVQKIIFKFIIFSIEKMTAQTDQTILSEKAKNVIMIITTMDWF